jgi:hypothetical protein
MRNISCLLIFILFFINFGFSQNQSIKTLVEKTKKLNLDMWELTTFAEKNIESKEELAKFFYYWIGSNIEYDYKTLQKSINNTISNEEFWKTQD